MCLGVLGRVFNWHLGHKSWDSTVWDVESRALSLSSHTFPRGSIYAAMMDF